MSSINRMTAINLKVERAEEHIRDLRARIKAFIATEPYKIVADDNLQPGRRCIIVAEAVPIPLTIPVVLGDVLQNLRSALDHLVYNLVIANIGRDPRDKQIIFPIYDSSSEYESRSPRKIRAVHKQAVDLIDALKPYRGGNDPLWSLNELNIIDKHRLLITVGHSYSNLTIDFGAVFKESIEKRTRPCIVIEGAVDTEIISALLKGIPSMPVPLKPADPVVEKGTVTLGCSVR
jgi:hypothetical protein